MSDDPEHPPEHEDRSAHSGRRAESVAMIISSGVMILFGLWVLLVTLRSDHSQGGTMMGAGIMIVLLILGGLGVYVGVRRLVWLRTFRRIWGHDPWEDEQ